MCKQQQRFHLKCIIEWRRGLALVLAVWPLLLGSVAAQVVIDQDTILESSVKDRLIVRDSAAGQTELRIMAQGEASSGLEAHDTAQVLVQGGTVRQPLDQFDRSRTVLEAGFIGTWTLADDAQGVMADGQAGTVKAAGGADFSMEDGKVNRLEARERAFLKLNAGTVREMDLSDRSVTEVRAIDSKMLQTSGQASAWLGGANVAQLQALERSNVRIQGSKLEQLNLRGDARVEVYGSELGEVSVGDFSGLLMEGGALLQSLQLRDQSRLQMRGATLAALAATDNTYAELSETNLSGQLFVRDQSSVELSGVKFGSPSGGGTLLRADGRANVQLNATFRDSMEIQLNQNAYLEGSLGVEFPSPSAGDLQIGLTDRSIAKLQSTGIPNVRMSVRDRAELDFSGPIGTLNLTAIAGGVVRLSSEVDEARINLNATSAVHVLSGPITGTVEGRLSEHQEPAGLFLHARSYTPLAQGRFTADLQDGTKADLVADGDFQLVLVDADGQQQAVDRDLRFNPANGHFYKMIRTPVDDWAAAKTAAEGMSFQGAGHLVTITSQQEEQFLVDQFALDGGGFWTNGVWIGASDAAEEGVWKWVTGPEDGQEFYRGGCGFPGCNDEFVTYADWARTKSGIDSQPQRADHEDYALWLTSRTLPVDSSGRWHDYPEDANAAGFLVEFEPLLGDADGDGQVSLADFGTVKRNFGRFGGFQQGDFNGDWTIDLGDFALLKQNFGKPAAPAPEPSAGVLAALALASLVCARSHRRSRWSVRN